MRSLKDKAYDILIILIFLNIIFINVKNITNVIEVSTEAKAEAAVEVNTEVTTELIEATEAVETTEVVEYTPTIKEIQDTPDNGKPLKNLKFNVQVKECNDKIIKGYTETKTSYTGDIIIHIQDTTKIDCKIKVGNTYLIEVEPTLKMSIPTEVNAVTIKERR